MIPADWPGYPSVAPASASKNYRQTAARIIPFNFKDGRTETLIQPLSNKLHTLDVNDNARRAACRSPRAHMALPRPTDRPCCAPLILCRTTPHRRFRATVITHRRKSGALHGFYCAGVRCQVTIAHLAGFRDGGAADTGDLHGRNHSKKPDPLTSGDHLGQISFSNSGSNRHRERALQGDPAILRAVSVIFR